MQAFADENHAAHPLLDHMASQRFAGSLVIHADQVVFASLWVVDDVPVEQDYRYSCFVELREDVVVEGIAVTANFVGGQDCGANPASDKTPRKFNGAAGGRVVFLLERGMA